MICRRELLSHSHRSLYKGSRIIPLLKTRSPKSLCAVSSTSSKSPKRFSKLCKSQWFYLGAIAISSGHLSNPLTSGFWLTSFSIPIAFCIQLNSRQQFGFHPVQIVQHCLDIGKHKILRQESQFDN